MDKDRELFRDIEKYLRSQKNHKEQKNVPEKESISSFYKEIESARNVAVDILDMDENFVRDWGEIMRFWKHNRYSDSDEVYLRRFELCKHTELRDYLVSNEIIAPTQNLFIQEFSDDEIPEMEISTGYILHDNEYAEIARVHIPANTNDASKAWVHINVFTQYPVKYNVMREDYRDWLYDCLQKPTVAIAEYLYNQNNNKK